MENKLLEYLNSVRTLEENKYVLGEAINNIENFIEGEEYKIEKTKEEETKKIDKLQNSFPEPPKKKIRTYHKNNFFDCIGEAWDGVGEYFAPSLVCGIGTAILGFIIGLIGSSFSNSEIFAYIGLLSFFIPPGLFLIVFILTLIFVSICNVADNRYVKKNIKNWELQNEMEYLSEYTKYMEEVSDTEENIKKAEQEAEQQIAVYSNKIIALKSNLEAYKKTYSDVKAALTQLYATGTVYVKYRDLIPITMFCEYLDSGRCTELRGVNGAYNLYEAEARADMIITKLEDIDYHLESICNEMSSSQNLLYRFLTRAEDTIDRLSDTAQAQIEFQKYQTKMLSDKVDALNKLESDRLQTIESMGKEIKSIEKDKVKVIKEISNKLSE